ncbi:uncharacterized protein EDB91DRAFT_1253155 [Suillus paluster]|uniref:uncharacterized protein n=1 Tax=Suillus paluster TaxID=48578 RepID=UPI001B85DF8A|nr:uncharacterized protein EDB91DRAFT_1253155 [Suillus paluster]KAG1729062.1 hypothetical protein EDB91DRAFT_1253155 [Suillus paluster]
MTFSKTCSLFPVLGQTPSQLLFAGLGIDSLGWPPSPLVRLPTPPPPFPSGLSNESLTPLSNLQNPDTEPPSAMDVDDPAMDPDLEWETVPETLKDDDTFVHAVWDIVGSQWRVYKDGRTWHQRVTHLQENWGPIINNLTLAYLTWKYPSESLPKDAAPPPSPSLSAPPSSYDFEIECIDLYTLSSVTHIQHNADVKTVSEALVLNGYIGATLQSPSIAISLRTLELYRRMLE